MIINIWSVALYRWLLLPISLLYGLISWLIRLSYQLGLQNVWHAPVPVVVVGNLTVGGSGKTPVVIWLVEQLTKIGIRVGVVSRGYGGKSKYYPLLIHTQTVTTEAGDEPVLIFQRTGVPVAVSPKRSEAVRALLNKYPIQIIISDDGLQHYALARDKEIVVIDGIHRFSNGWWLPVGPMRESVSRLRNVDAIIVNGGNIKTGEIAMHLRHGLAINLLTNERIEIKKLHNLVAIAGIAHPTRFFTMIENYGIKLERKIALSDHQMLNLNQITKMVSPKQSLIMTEKDAVKYRAFAYSNWWYLPVDAELSGDKINQLLKQLISLV